jgi:hypothetical protein
MLAFACNDGVVFDPNGNLSLDPVAASSAGAVVEMVTGSGHFTTPPLSVNPGRWRTFSMTARRYADGSVKGRFQRVIHFEDGAEAVRGVITCFTIIGNKAWIGGSVAANFPPDIAWQVVDNGEGAGDPPDRNGLQLPASTFGFPAGFAQDFCESTPDELNFGPPFGVVPLSAILNAIESGNIQIRVK